jgi:hypothetical protein
MKIIIFLAFLFALLFIYLFFSFTVEGFAGKLCEYSYLSPIQKDAKWNPKTKKDFMESYNTQNSQLKNEFKINNKNIDEYMSNYVTEDEAVHYIKHRAFPINLYISNLLDIDQSINQSIKNITKSYVIDDTEYNSLNISKLQSSRMIFFTFLYDRTNSEHESYRIFIGKMTAPSC